MIAPDPGSCTRETSARAQQGPDFLYTETHAHHTKLFHIHSLQGFFNLSTWITAITGAAVLLLAFHLISGRSSGRFRRSGRSGRFAHR